MTYAEIETTELAAARTPAELEQALVGTFYGVADYEEDGITSVSTYADAGVLTSNAGLVLRMHDGTEFQITIVQSR